MFQRLEGDCARGFWCGGKQLGTQVHLRDLPFSSRSSTVLLLLCKSLVLHAFVYHLLAWIFGLVAKAVQLTFYDVVAFIQPAMLCGCLGFFVGHFGGTNKSTNKFIFN